MEWRFFEYLKYLNGIETVLFYSLMIRQGSMKLAGHVAIMSEIKCLTKFDSLTRRGMVAFKTGLGGRIVLKWIL